MITIDPREGTPIYRQIMDQVRFAVASGVLGAGDELPSTRALAARHGLNPMTVSKAYGLLEMEGLLERRRGDGLFVARLRQDRKSVGKNQLLEQSLAKEKEKARKKRNDDDKPARTPVARTRRQHPTNSAFRRIILTDPPTRNRPRAHSGRRRRVRNGGRVAHTGSEPPGMSSGNTR